jgi:hypothetical protein
MIKSAVVAVGSLLLIATTSCLSPVDCGGLYIYNEKSFTSEQQGWIEESAVRWNAWVGRRVITVLPGPSKDACSIDTGVIDGRAIGEYRNLSGTITIDTPQLYQRDENNSTHFEAIIIHELGHSLGFPHIGVKNQDALMSPVGATEFSNIDRIECIKLGLCLTL